MIEKGCEIDKEHVRVLSSSLLHFHKLSYYLYFAFFFQTGDGLEKVPVGRQATFFIEGQMEMGDPEVKVLSPQRKIVPSSIRFELNLWSLDLLACTNLSFVYSYLSEKHCFNA